MKIIQIQINNKMKKLKEKIWMKLIIYNKKKCKMMIKNLKNLKIFKIMIVKVIFLHNIQIQMIVSFLKILKSKDFN